MPAGKDGLRAGHLEEAEAAFSQSLSEVADPGVPFGSALHGLADIALKRGAREAARQLIDEALGLLGRGLATRERAAFLASSGDVAREEGSVRRALSLQSTALQIRRDIGHAPGLPDSLEALGALAIDTGQLQRAGRLLAAGDNLRRSIGLARHPVDRPAHDAAIVAVRESLGVQAFDHTWAAGVKMTRADAISYALRGSGRRMRPVPGWAGLTRMEHDMVALVADGLTNAEIGERLFISPKTVEAHLTHIFNKLGLSSRRELAKRLSAGRDRRRPPSTRDLRWDRHGRVTRDWARSAARQPLSTGRRPRSPRERRARPG